MSIDLKKALPRWQCNEIVEAVQITGIAYDSDIARSEGRKETDNGAYLYHDAEGIPAIKVSQQYIIKHHPEEGGYFIKNADGGLSYSTAESFEAGHTRVSKTGE